MSMGGSRGRRSAFAIAQDAAARGAALSSVTQRPPAIAAVSAQTEEEVRRVLAEPPRAGHQRDLHGRRCPSLLEARGKSILRDGSAAILGQLDASPLDVAKAMEPDASPEDIKTFIAELVRLAR